MKYEINLVKSANQEFSCNLKNGNKTYSVDIRLRTMPSGFLLADVVVDNELQRLSVICHNKMPLLANDVLGGNLYFNDIYGDTDPVFDELGDRYKLIYDTEYKLV